MRGFLHRPTKPVAQLAVALTHGAGSDCNSIMLREIAGTLAEAGIPALRYNLAFRNRRPSGMPAGSGAEDRESVRDAVAFLSCATEAPVVAGGHSYGGRMTSIAAAEDGTGFRGLLLFSYPLHPPRKPDTLRTVHFPALQTPALFIHGTRDPFGSPDEMKVALALIPASAQLTLLEGAGHELRKPATWCSQILDAFRSFFITESAPQP
ncbi:MAG TPA: alpha/beta family hydrolase [Bryobacteraceae bacterium]|nr:alpha/beta family hydrolase [Bryobacteraceae bacterium]